MRAEDVRYYPLGDAMYPDMLTDLRAAKKTIYLEYFIIEPGEMWQEHRQTSSRRRCARGWTCA